MHDTFDFPFHARGYRNDQTAVAHGGGYIFVDVSFRLGRPEDAVQAARDTSGGRRKFPSDAQQFRGSIVLYFSELVENAVNAGNQLWKGQDISRQFM